MTVTTTRRKTLTTGEAKALKEAEVELCIERERFRSEIDRYERKGRR